MHVCTFLYACSSNFIAIATELRKNSSYKCCIAQIDRQKKLASARYCENLFIRLKSDSCHNCNCSSVRRTFKKEWASSVNGILFCDDVAAKTTCFLCVRVEIILNSIDCYSLMYIRRTAKTRVATTAFQFQAPHVQAFSLLSPGRRREVWKVDECTGEFLIQKNRWPLFAVV